MRAVRPGRHFLGGGKIEATPKNLGRVKGILRGEKFLEGITKELPMSKEKKVVKKFLRYNRNILRGGRHPSYATARTL